MAVTNQYRNYGRHMVFNGKGAKPTSFDTEGDLIRYISETEGAIGYIDINTPPGDTKKIAIN